MRTRFPLRAIATLALLAAGLSACTDGDSRDDGSTLVPAEQPGVLRTLTAWAGSPDAGGSGYRDGTGSEARFLLADAGSPTLIQDAADEQTLYVLMPMRV